MSGARTIPAVLAALATICVSLPLTTLFRDAAWLPQAVLGILVVTLTGIVLRSLVDLTGVTVLAQVLAGWAYVLTTQLGDTTSYLIMPTGRTATRFMDHVRDAQETITTYAAPAPETPGVTAALVLVVMVVGLAVDMAAATAGSPTMAGLPLFSLFLISAANSGGSLPWVWFLLGAGLWLMMVAAQSDRDLREWTTSVPLIGHGRGQDLAGQSLRWQAARMAGLGLVAALVLPTLLPHLPTRYLLDGLGAGGAGTARSTDGIRLSTQLDLRRSLQSPSREPVLRYTTNDPTPQPLRVAVVTDFRDGLGRMRSNALQPLEGFRPPAPLDDVAEDVDRQERTLVVEANGVAAPQMAVPDHVTAVDTGGIPWALGADGTARVQRTPGSYSASFIEIAPLEEDFGQDPAGVPLDPQAYDDEHLALDPASAEVVQQLASELAPDGTADLAAAQAFQEYLRGPEFSYSLELPAAEGLPEDPILAFLETKVGYCQQFASTMTLLARAHGIPARVVVGFLPGEAAGADERVIRASDAHAWPELYFEGVGWTRFEPTPGARAASVPGYSISTERSGSVVTDDTTTATESAATAATPTTSAGQDETAIDTGTAQSGPTGWLRWLLGALLAVAALAILPVTALLARRRERARAADDAARTERGWEDLLRRLEDLGIRPPTGATPRHVGEWVARRAHLGESGRERLAHVVTTLERARYGRPGQALPDISADVSSIVAEVRDQRMASSRLRAALWPRAGVDAWQSLPGRMSDLVRRR